MRVETKLAVLKKFTENNHFVIRATPIMNQERFVIQNWQEVLTALRVLREIEWLGEDRQSQLLDDYIKNRHDIKQLELSQAEFQQLHEAGQRYNNGLNIVLAILEGHAADASPSTIWVELQPTTDPIRMANTIQDMTGILKRAGQAGEAFRFVGVAQGSDWFGFAPPSEFMATVINYCIHLSASVLADVQRMPDALIRSVITLLVEETGEKDPEATSEAKVELTKERIKDELVERGTARFRDELVEAGYSKTEANRIHNALKATTRNILKLTEEGRAIFEPAEDSNINISIVGEKIEVRNLIIKNPKQLPPSTK